MKEFKTISEFQQYRKVCPVCHRQLFFKGCASIGESFLMKVAYKSEDYIFTIGIKNPRIMYSVANISVPSSSFGYNRTSVNSINPLKITCICSKNAKEGTLVSHLSNEYSAEFGIFHDGKQQGVIQKIQLLSESFIFFNNKRFYVVKLAHTTSKCSVEELDNLFKIKKTHILKYEFINQDKIYNQDYILNKIQTITLLQ